MLITPPPTKAGSDSFFMRDWMTKLQKVINEQGSIDLSSPTPIGDVAPNTGAFTTLTSVVNTTTPALRVTQTGTGHALVVEDVVTDTTPFVIDANGDVGVGLVPTARNNTRLQLVNGIGFPATQVTSTDVNTLDDYEEGTWTPSLFATGATFNYTVQQGSYTKIGNSVTATCVVTLAGSGNTLTANQLFIQNLPFASRNTANQFFAGSFVWSNFATAMTFATAQIAPNSTSIAVFKTTVAATSVALMNANDLSATAGSIINVTVTYFTA